MDTFTILAVIVIAGLLGAAGQGARIIQGLKKAKTKGIAYKAFRLKLSLGLSLVIGGVSGVLYLLANFDQPLTKAVLLAFVGAGYAGTDFLEGVLEFDKDWTPMEHGIGLS